jgi:hypothetical protein
MRSILATLRTLVLPGGATTGRRIVLDGVAGTISIYDANNVLRIRLGFSSDDLELWSGQVSEFLAGNLQAYPVGSGVSAARRVGMILESGSFNGRDKGHINIDSESFDGTIDPVITYSGKNHNFEAPVGEPRLSLGGIALGGVYSTPSSFPPAGFTGLVVFETDTGRLTGFDGTRTIQLNSPMQAAGWKFEKTTDTVLSTTAGTYTTIITTGNLALRAGRLYKITAVLGAYVVTAGSGWATGDTFRARIYRSIGGAAFATMRRNHAWRTNVAIASVHLAPTLIGFFSPAVDGNVEFKLEASKTAGAATVTTTVSVDAGEGYSELVVEDIGPSAGALH